MRTVTFTEFRKNASRILSAVEEGEQIVVLRHGRSVAEIRPASRGTDVPSWKKPGLRLTVKGAELSSIILREREGEDVL